MGTLGGTQYRNTVRKNWRILKYRVENGRNTDTAFMTGDAYLALYPNSRVCVFFNLFIYFFISSMYTPELNLSLRHVRRSRIDRYKDRKARSLDVLPHHRVFQKLCIHLRLRLKSSKYWPTLDRRGQMNSTAIPSRIFFLPARRMKNRIPHGWMIPQYRTLKSKLPKYRLEKSWETSASRE